MRIITILILLMLQPLAVMAGSETPGVQDTDAENELSAIAPNDFNATLNYSYEEIDHHALNAPPSAEATVESLAAYLIEPAKNDREKARAIFRWITDNIDYNVEVFFKGGTGPTNSEDVLKSRKSVCYGYSDIFLSLAREAGLQAVRISGYGKGYGYQPGENFTGPSNHAWNGVMINRSWYLIDSTWGAGYVSRDRKYVRWFDDHFFMTPPSQFIYDHFPEDTRWQLLDRPVSKQEYENLVYLEPDFFRLDLKPVQKNGTISADKQINISIFAPQDVLMTAGLEYAKPGAGGALDGYTFCQRDGERYDIYAQFPAAGNYILKAYAKQKDEPGDYSSVLKYRIYAASGGGAGFPMAFGKFSEMGSYLYGPLEGKLKVGSSYLFRIRVPGAKNVSVVCGEEWTHLAMRGVDLFEGNATAKKGDVGIYVNFGGEGWDGLVRYEGE
jgi:hypothetical protein